MMILVCGKKHMPISTDPSLKSYSEPAATERTEPKLISGVERFTPSSQCHFPVTLSHNGQGVSQGRSDSSLLRRQASAWLELVLTKVKEPPKILPEL